MDNLASISPTLGHYKGGMVAHIRLNAEPSPSADYMVTFQSIYDNKRSSTASGTVLDNGCLEIVLPDHGTPDVTTVTISAKQASRHFMSVAQFQFQDPLCTLISSKDPSSLEDVQLVMSTVAMLTSEDDMTHASPPLDDFLVVAFGQQPPLVSSIELRACFEGCKLSYSNDKTTLFHLAANLGLPRLADMLTNRAPDIRYSLKTELLRRTSSGNSPLACARKNVTERGRQVKLVYAEAIAELNESKYDKGKLSKKQGKTHGRTRSLTEQRSRDNSVTRADREDPGMVESDGEKTALGSKTKRRVPLFNKKKLKSDAKAEITEPAQPWTPQPNALVYSVGILNLSSDSDSGSGPTKRSQQTVPYFWNHAHAFYVVTSDFQPKPSDKDAGMLALKTGEVALAIKADGTKPNTAYGLVNNARVGTFPLDHLQRIAKPEAREKLNYHLARKTASLPSINPSSAEHTGEREQDDYEVMNRSKQFSSDVADRIHVSSVQWYEVTHQAEIRKPFSASIPHANPDDYLPLQVGDVVNVVCMPDNEEWALVESGGRVGRTLYASMRSMPEHASHALQDPIHLDSAIGRKPIQPGDVLSVGITYGNTLKIAAIRYAEDDQAPSPLSRTGSLRKSEKQEVLYDTPDAGAHRLIDTQCIQEENESGESTSSQGDVGTGFDDAADTPPRGVSPMRTSQGGPQMLDDTLMQGIAASSSFQQSKYGVQACSQNVRAGRGSDQATGVSSPAKQRFPLPTGSHSLPQSPRNPGKSQKAFFSAKRSRTGEGDSNDASGSPKGVESLARNVKSRPVAGAESQLQGDEVRKVAEGSQIGSRLPSAAPASPSGSPQRPTPRPTLRISAPTASPTKQHTLQSPMAGTPPVLCPKPKLLAAKSMPPPVSPKPVRRDQLGQAESAGVNSMESLKWDTVRRSLSTELPFFKSLHLPPSSHEADRALSPRLGRRTFPRMAVDTSHAAPPKSPR